jgi:hypothetical protein
MKTNKQKIQLRKLTRCTNPTKKPWGGQEDPTKNPGVDKRTPPKTLGWTRVICMFTFESQDNR